MKANISKTIINLSLLLSVAAVALVGCASSDRTLDLEDFACVKYQPRYATGFEIVMPADSSARLLRVVRPWQGAEHNDHHLLMVDESVADLPLGFDGAVVRGAVDRVVAMSSGSVAMFDRLGVGDRVVGVSGLDYISSAAIVDGAARGEVFDVGYGSNLNFELIVSLSPDLVLLYGVTGEDESITAKLTELNIPYIYIGDYAEQSPLAKAEWLVAIGEMCGVGQQAADEFDRIAERYESLCSMVAADSLLERPRVMLNAPYRDVWYMPSSDNYIVRLIEDAGGEYIYDGNHSGSTQPISIETAYGLMMQCDRWLNVGSMVRTLDVLRSQVPKFKDMPVVVAGEVYNTTARSTAAGGSDFWESGLVCPDVVLADLVRIMHPGLLPDHRFYYYEALR